MIIEKIIGQGSSIDKELCLCNDIDILAKSLNTSGNLFNADESGTALRFLTAYLSVTEGEFILTGSSQLQHRPIAPLVDALCQLGVKIEYLKNKGYCPLKITGGQIIGNEVMIDGSISSQFISGLLLIAPTFENGLVIHITNHIVSKSYIDLTIGIMKDFGAHVSWVKDNTIEVQPAHYIPRESYTIEKDWTAASYWFALKALAEYHGISCEADIEDWRLNKNSLQGDAIIPSLIEMCLRTEYIEYDFCNNLDLVPTMAVLCCGLNKPFKFTGLETLQLKESRRLTALQTELSNAGFNIDSQTSTLNFRPMTQSSSSLGKIKRSFSSYSDHRLAMAFSLLAIVFEEITIKDMGVVAKSYPNYWDDLSKSGLI